MTLIHWLEWRIGPTSLVGCGELFVVCGHLFCRVSENFSFIPATQLPLTDLEPLRSGRTARFTEAPFGLGCLSVIEPLHVRRFLLESASLFSHEQLHNVNSFVVKLIRPQMFDPRSDSWSTTGS